MNEAVMSTRIVPALVTLANDADMRVRVATVAAFGAIMECVTQSDVGILIIPMLDIEYAGVGQDPYAVADVPGRSDLHRRTLDAYRADSDLWSSWSQC